MAAHKIRIKRDEKYGFLSKQSVGTDAFNALGTIPGVKDPEIVWESDEEVELTYDWDGAAQFWDTENHLRKFGLAKVSGS